ncbi:glycosyltransferase family 4 protein, partial [Flavobacterium sp. FPG59]|uniref:glycosyltransferase family 4 protein n=1 Tax=Flavobacterium sp. FPG59 TaxID=1929267 RepID=UPI000A3BC554
MSEKDFDVTLISSQSSNIKVYQNLKGYYELKTDGYLKIFLLKGPRISLGFSFLRLWSWILFEWYVLKLSLFGKQLKKPDVVIISSLSLLTFCSGVLLKWKYKTKLIIEVRDIWPLTLIEIGSYSKYNPIVIILRGIEKLGYSSADAIVGTMPNLKEHVRKSIKKKTPVYCVPQGYDSNIFVSDLSDISKIKLDKIRFDKFSVVYAGTIGKANNIDLILSVAEKLMIKADKVHFYLLGDGPLKNKYLYESADLTNVTFIEPVPSAELSLFLSNFNLLICPIANQSIYRFGISPNKIVDYLRSGRPILFSYNGYPSFINGDKYSFTVSADDSELFAAKLEAILEMSEDTLIEMGKNGLSTVENYHSFDFLADRY